MIYKRHLFNRIFVGLARIRYRKGYGVQSPSVFHFIRNVIFESTPYYEYERLKPIYRAMKAFEHNRMLPRKRYELIFRIANAVKASEIIEIGSYTGLGSMYASAARKFAKCHILNEHPITNPEIQRILSKNPSPIVQNPGATEPLLSERLGTANKEIIRLIVFNSEFFSAAESARIIAFILERSQSEDCVIFSGLQRSKELRQLWKKCTSHPLAGISFDLYEAGILFFKPSAQQKCYLINY